MEATSIFQQVRCPRYQWPIGERAFYPHLEKEVYHPIRPREIVIGSLVVPEAPHVKKGGLNFEMTTFRIHRPAWRAGQREQLTLAFKASIYTVLEERVANLLFE